MAYTEHPEILTIVIPVYNRAGIVGRTLDSVAAQTYRPLRLIIVDNNSTDASLSVVSKWADAHRADDFSIEVFSETRGGAAWARQRGVDAVTTPWTLHFDSDDTMRPNHIERVVAGIKGNPEADIVGWDVLTHHSDGHTKVERFFPKATMVNHLFHSSLSSLRYAVRTDLLKHVGGWETDIRGWDDYVLGVKLLLRNPMVAKLGNDITVDVYIQDVSVSGTSFSEKSGEWEAALDRCQQLVLQSGRHEYLRWITARRAILSGHYTAEGNPLGIKELAEACMCLTPYVRWALRRIHNRVAHRRRGTAWLCRILLSYCKC